LGPRLIERLQRDQAQIVSGVRLARRAAKGSANRRRARAKRARLHARITTIRSEAQHRLTTDLTRRFHTIGIKEAAMRGGQIVVADRFFASSKTCSDCGHKLEALPSRFGIGPVRDVARSMTATQMLRSI